jgi:hypothetical protein
MKQSGQKSERNVTFFPLPSGRRRARDGNGTARHTPTPIRSNGKRRTERETTTRTTGRMNPEYDYLFKLLVRASERRWMRDDAGFFAGWIIVGHARVPLRSCTRVCDWMNECVRV